MLLERLSEGRGDVLTSLSLVPASVTVRKSDRSQTAALLKKGVVFQPLLLLFGLFEVILNKCSINVARGLNVYPFYNDVLLTSDRLVSSYNVRRLDLCRFQAYNRPLLQNFSVFCSQELWRPSRLRSLTPSVFHIHAVSQPLYPELLVFGQSNNHRPCIFHDPY